jgi:hypothetical protein
MPLFFYEQVKRLGMRGVSPDVLVTLDNFGMVRFFIHDSFYYISSWGYLPVDP